MAYSDEMKVFSGTASGILTERLCAHLGIECGNAHVQRFSDGEIRVQFQENIRGKDVFLVNSTSPPVNEHLVELLILIDAARRASAARITAVLPYFGYARQDRKDRPRVPITAKLVSNLIVAAGANRVLAVDLHCDQIQGFFDIPVDHLSGEVAFTKHFRQLRPSNDFVVVSPDTGSVHRIRRFAKRLEVPLAIVDKRRPKANVSEVMNLIGEVKDRHAIIFDDLIDTGGTLVKAAEAIKARGAIDVIACATHAVFSGQAVSRIANSVLEEVWVSDSIPLSEEAAACPKIKVLSIASLIAEGIRRIHAEESVSILFE
ncbi:MAG TPA: ribose-phosphate pyrophosphokinase [Candidatus Hydrogenedentes bacterium]|nr:ribose-phosphate pyrophosphokinase [Candidatus Hydrogenedentota bacterium]